MYVQGKKLKMTLKKIPVRILVYDKGIAPQVDETLEGYYYFDILQKATTRIRCDETRPITAVTKVFKGVYVCNMQEKAVYICLTKAAFLKNSYSIENKTPSIVFNSNIPKKLGTLKEFYNYQYNCGTPEYFGAKRFVKESKTILEVKGIAPGVFLAETLTERYLVVL